MSVALFRYALLFVVLVAMPQRLWAGAKPMTVFEPVAFRDIPGWAADNHPAALLAFQQACAAAPGAGPEAVRAGLSKLCTLVKQMPPPDISDPAKARHFFETQFAPFRIKHDAADGLLTGYFEPELDGSLELSAEFHVPVLKRPGDLVDVVAATDRAAANAEGRLASMRKTGTQLTPYFTRAEIEGGALKGRGLELLYLQDAVDA